MRTVCLGHALLVLLLAAPTSAATITTLSIADTSIYDTSTILASSFLDDGNGGGTLALVRTLDELSVAFLLATVTGTQFSAATVIAYDGLVSPATELYRYTLAGQVTFSSYQLFDGPIPPKESIQLSADSIIRTEGPATPVPEPASALLLLTGGAFAFARRARSSRASMTRPPT